MSGNSGVIKLQVADDLNVDLKVSGLCGSVSSELPNVQFQKTGAADLPCTHPVWRTDQDPRFVGQYLA